MACQRSKRDHAKYAAPTRPTFKLRFTTSQHPRSALATGVGRPSTPQQSAAHQRSPPSATQASPRDVSGLYMSSFVSFHRLPWLIPIRGEDLQGRDNSPMIPRGVQEDITKNNARAGGKRVKIHQGKGEASYMCCSGKSTPSVCALGAPGRFSPRYPVCAPLLPRGAPGIHLRDQTLYKKVVRSAAPVEQPTEKCDRMTAEPFVPPVDTAVDGRLGKSARPFQIHQRAACKERLFHATQVAPWCGWGPKIRRAMCTAAPSLDLGSSLHIHPQLL